MRKIVCISFMLGLMVLMTSSAYATTINYSINDLGSGQWEYSYSITNDTLSSDIEEFTIYFQYGLYDNLAVTSSASDWDSLTINPQDILGYPQDGFFDSLALVSGIAPGDTLGSLSVAFDWLGTGTPGSQLFDIVRPTDYSVIDSGTTAQNITSVPEPGSMQLLLTGLAGLLFFRRNNSKA